MPCMPNDEGPGAGPPNERFIEEGGHAADRLREFERARGIEPDLPSSEPVDKAPASGTTKPRRRAPD